MYTIGVDIGGMSVKIGLVDDNGKIVCDKRVKTAKTANEVIADIVNEINQILNEKKLKVTNILGIGIGCPGTVTDETGVVEFLPNLGWENVPLVKELKKHFDIDIKISNDANVATLAEFIYGSAKDYNNCVMFTLGTGVGGGIILNKKLFEGGSSRGAEFGHVTLFLDGEQCPCGRKGCVECYTSVTALIKQTKKAMIENRNSSMWDYADGNLDNVNGKTAFECAKKGDTTANRVVDRYVYYLAESMLNVFNVFRPDAFIIGGGISGQGDYLVKKLKAYCEKFDYGYKRAPKTEIITAMLGSDAGIIGAAALFK